MTDVKYFQEFASSGTLTDIYINGTNNSNEVITIEDIPVNFLYNDILMSRFNSGFYTSIHSGSSNSLHELATQQYVLEKVELGGIYSDSDVKAYLTNTNNLSFFYVGGNQAATMKDLDTSNIYTDEDAVALLGSGDIDSIYVYDSGGKVKLATEDFVDSENSLELKKDVDAKYISASTYTPISTDRAKTIYMTNANVKEIILDANVFSENIQLAITNLTNTAINFTSDSLINGSTDPVLNAIPRNVSVYITRYNTGFLVAGVAQEVVQGDIPELTAVSSIRVDEGSQAQFTSTVTSDVAYTQEWEYRLDSTSSWLPTGNTTNTYTIAAVNILQTGNQFRLSATNEFGTGWSTAGILTVDASANTDGLAIDGEFWTYNGEHILLAGGFTGGEPFLYKQGTTFGDGTVDELTLELNTLKNAGGNYIRNTMANFLNPHVDARNIQDFPFTGYPNSFDLTSKNNSYFERLDSLLTKAETRGIIVSIELWEPWMLPKSNTWLTDGSDGRSCYWRPGNTKTYTTDTGLPNTKQTTNDSFYATVESPNSNNAVVLAAQKRFVDWVCIEAAKHKNVVIQIENESNATTDWDNFWADYVRGKGLGIPVTTMRDDHDVSTPNAKTAQSDSTGRYQFSDTSQQWWKKTNMDDEFKDLLNHHTAGTKPVNAIKIYSSYNTSSGYHTEAIDYFFISIIGGNAACAFHPGRGPSTITNGQNGLGTHLRARKAIAIARLIDNAFDLTSATPVTLPADSGNYTTWRYRDYRDAYATDGASEYLIYFASFQTGGIHFNVSDIWGGSKTVKVTWYNVNTQYLLNSDNTLDTSGPIPNTVNVSEGTTSGKIPLSRPDGNSYNQWVAHITPI